MSPNDSAQIAKLIEVVQGLRQDIAVMNTKLFGDEDKETDQGRIPRLEAQVETHARRLRRVEPIALALRGLGALILAGGGYLLNHFFPMKGH